MAGYSEKRENNLDIKVLRKALSVVDDNITIPDSVRGSALRQKLDSVQPAEPAAPDKKSGIVFGLKWFSLQSGLTYVAAFTLIVGLFYGLGMHQQPDVVEGQMALPDSGVQPRMLLDSDIDIILENDEIQPFYAPSDTINPTSGGMDSDDAGTVQAVEPEHSNPAAITPRGSVTGGGRIDGVGGGGESAILGNQDGYSYAWRTNDASDPDKGSYPITVEIIGDDQAQPVATIDIPGMQSIEKVHFGADTLSLVGSTGSGVVTRTYSIETPDAPVELVVLEQPGTYVSSRLHNSVVHTVTYSEDVSRISCETEELPGAVSTDTACVVSAVDTGTLDINQRAFLGADQDISLLERGTYITYEAEVSEEAATAENAPTEESVPHEIPEDGAEETDYQDVDTPPSDDGIGAEEATTYYAQIVLQGTDISLGSVTP